MNQSKAIRFLLSSVLRELALKTTGQDSQKVKSLLDELSVDIEKIEQAKEGQASKKVKHAIIQFAQSQPPLVVPLSDFQFYKRGLSSYEDKNRDQNRLKGYEILCQIAEQKHDADFSSLLRGLRDSPVGALSTEEESPSSKPLLGLLLSILGLVAFFVAFWQGQRTFNFTDSTYLIENIYRLYNGEQPYRDFFLVLPPAHYYLHGSLFSLFGAHAKTLLYSGALIHALTVVATFFAVRHWNKNPWICALLAGLVIPGGMARLCFPLYDSDAGFFFVLLVNAALTWEKKNYHHGWGFLTGALTAVITLTKYNIGLPVFAGFILVFLASSFLYKTFRFKTSLSFFIGFATVIGLLYLFYSSSETLQPFIYQTLDFPRRGRLSFFPRLFASINPKLLVDQFLLFDFQHSRFIWRLLILLGCLLPFVKWLTGTHPEPIKATILIPTMGFVLGAMQSQVLGSTYGIYPAASLILINLYLFLQPVSKRLALVTMSVLVLAFGASTSYEAAAGHRLYFLKRVFEETASFKIKPMNGFAVTESYLNTFESIVLKSEDLIPREDEVFFWPGDAPFYYATQRRCPLKNFQVLAATGLNTSNAMKQLDKKKVPWIIIRTSDDQSPFPLHIKNPIVQAWFSKNYSIVYSQDEFVIGKRKK